MQATHHQGDRCPEPQQAPDHSFVSGKPDLKAMSQQEFYLWATGTSSTPTPDGGDGYTVTDAGLKALDAAPAEQAPGTAARILRSAALYLERHGWIQGCYYDATSGSFTPPACLVGAVGMVCYGGPVDAPAQHFDDPGFLDFDEAVLHLDRYLLAEDGTEAYEFNDAKGRTVDDVTRVLRAAADRPAHELIDALRAIDAHNVEVAARTGALTPSGVFVGSATQDCWCDCPDEADAPCCPETDLCGHCTARHGATTGDAE